MFCAYCEPLRSYYRFFVRFVMADSRIQPLGGVTKRDWYHQSLCFCDLIHKIIFWKFSYWSYRQRFNLNQWVGCGFRPSKQVGSKSFVVQCASAFWVVRRCSPLISCWDICENAQAGNPYSTPNFGAVGVIPLGERVTTIHWRGTPLDRRRGLVYSIWVPTTRCVSCAYTHETKQRKRLGQVTTSPMRLEISVAKSGRIW